MVVRFEHPDYAGTSSYRYDWEQGGVIVHSQTVPKGWVGPLAGTTPQMYEQAGGFTKPSPLTGSYTLKVVAINAVGESAAVASAPFSASAPAPVSNIQVIDPHL
jgi:hypothetical protein